MSSRQLKAQFRKYVLSKLWEAESLTNDPLGYVRNLIVDLGGVEVAKVLVDPHEVREPSTGFLRLLENSLARLTIEQAIMDFANTGLFTKAEVEAARARLSIFGKPKPR